MPTSSRPGGGVPAVSGHPPAWLVGPQWGELRLRQPGWLILPLRGFLAVTFIYAGLQKLANRNYLNPQNPSSVVGQMRLLRHVSPIGALLGLSLHAPTLVGLLIAFGELSVGVAVFLGLWTRVAAVGGMVLSLTFLLTVSWRTTPYYYGSDIVFLFAWTIFAGFGAANVLSADAWLHERARAAVGLRPLPVAAEDLRPAVAADLERRRLLFGLRAVAITGVATLAGGGVVAWLGRVIGGTSTSHQLSLRGEPGPRASPTSSTTAPHRTSRARAAPPPGTAIGRASQVPVGQAGRFTDPATGNPAWLVHTSGSDFAAFSAVCTHAGCTVNFDAGSMQFICPCHGGTYDARTGRVLGGPPPSPLSGIPVHVVNGEIRVN